MAITVKYLEGLGVDKETAEKIFAERGAEIEKRKGEQHAYPILRYACCLQIYHFSNITA